MLDLHPIHHRNQILRPRNLRSLNFDSVIRASSVVSLVFKGEGEVLNKGGLVLQRMLKLEKLLLEEVARGSRLPGHPLGFSTNSIQ